MGRFSQRAMVVAIVLMAEWGFAMPTSRPGIEPAVSPAAISLSINARVFTYQENQPAGELTLGVVRNTPLEVRGRFTNVGTTSGEIPRAFIRISQQGLILFEGTEELVSGPDFSGRRDRTLGFRFQVALERIPGLIDGSAEAAVYVQGFEITVPFRLEVRLEQDVAQGAVHGENKSIANGRGFVIPP